MNERIKKLRKALDLTQQKFADRLGMKQNTIATYEMGRATPSDPTIKSICREFNVNEDWLRTGEGGDAAMFVKQTKEDELKAAVNKLLSGETSEFKSRLVNVLAGLNEEQWVFLQQKMEEIVSGKEAPAASIHTQTRQEQARAKAEEYYRQLLLEEEPEEESSASQSDTGSDTEETA